MRTTGLFFILSCLTFKCIVSTPSCLSSHNDTLYLIETNTSSIHIQSLPLSVVNSSSSASSSSELLLNNGNPSSIPWAFASETQQGVASLISCTNVQNYLFLLFTVPIQYREDINQDNGDSNTYSSSSDVDSIDRGNARLLAFNYITQVWVSVPLRVYSIIDKSTLIPSAWQQNYIVYNTERQTMYYFNTQQWGWHSFEHQQFYQAPPSISLVNDAQPETTVINDTLYYIYRLDQWNHMYTFDLALGKWNGYLASFWSEIPSAFFSFSDDQHEDRLYVLSYLNTDFSIQSLRTIMLSTNHSFLEMEIPTLKSFPNETLPTVVHRQSALIMYNGTTLTSYQPFSNSISAIYPNHMSGNDPPTGVTPLSSSPATSSFWSTTEGQRIKIALSCSLGLCMVLVSMFGVIVIHRRRKNRHSPLAPNHRTRETKPVPKATKSPSMQSLSFLNRDNAMVWSRNVHQLLALIAFHHEREQNGNGNSSALPTSAQPTPTEYPSMIKTSSTVSALAMSSVILSLISSSYSISAQQFLNASQANHTPSSLDMACPSPRNSLGQAESSQLPQLET